jgi:uncharacterized protein YegL
MTITDDQLAEETRRPQTQDGDVVMPFYVVADKSLSMEHLEEALTKGIQGVQQEIIDHPEIADVVQVGIILFDTTASVLVPLGELETADIPRIVASGGTVYSAAFTTLHDVIAGDIARFKSQGLNTYRPLVFFLSDGEPNPSDHDWEGTFQRLFHFNPETGEGNRHYPRVIPIGFGGAEMSTMAKLAYPPHDGVAFIQKDGTTIQDAFNAILPLVGRTILASGRTALAAGATGAEPSHAVPKDLPGFAPVASQYPGGDWM